ncbi:MAG TPA: hypothetical protein VMP00_13975 [Burkholderiales bacterium]|nr:hypothetical protein [Burkholderiales bacterium]
MFGERDRFSMNRDRLLPEAKARALTLAENYAPAKESTFTALGTKGLDAMQAILDALEARGIATPHDRAVGKHLARVLCGGELKEGEKMSEQDVLVLEREAFLALCETPATVARIEHMLAEGKPLRNRT